MSGFQIILYTKARVSGGGGNLLREKEPEGEDGQENPQKDAIIHFSLVDIATQQLKKCIEEGFFVPEEKISAAGLSKEMGISRTTIRKALLILEKQGMVKHVPGYGMVVLGK